ncbi:MAG: DEAD/DEAH box helicase [Spirochaetes bacterium]|nr:DEAD/DEAH box helicase [Spirochaetota bacterium]MBU1081081.1 DEAD/DEAH box helicase [Spirochaetota bacterium]
MPSPTFAEFGFSAPVIEALARKGFEEPTPIQALAIPVLLRGTEHLVARARTGTGKTAAFGLPLVERLSAPGPKVRALILVPTRELAVQVSGEIASFAPGPTPRIATVYGGASMSEQLRRLSRGVDIVVGTPGRVIDHIDRKTLDLSGLEWLVLDEADEMLDMGFIEDIEKVMDASNPERRVVLFSATMPYPIVRIARERLGSFTTVEDTTNPVQAGLTDQIWLEVRERDKLEALCRIVDAEDEFYGLVFCHTKIETDAVARALSERGYAAEALHGDVSQDMRERTLGRFREKKTLILVATDVAARGIDVERLTHVVNFNLPFDPESYTHRIGRTGRAGNKGTAITFVTPEEYRRLFALRRASGDGLHKGSVPTVSDVIEAKRARIKAKTAGAAREVLGLSFHTDEDDDEDALLDGSAASDEAAARPDAEPRESDADADADSAEGSGELGGKKSPGSEKAAKPIVVAPKKTNPSVVAFYELADELLAILPPRDALASLAAAAYSGDLDPRRYGEVRDVSVDSAATARLYVGIGKQDGAWPKDVAAVVKRLTGLPDRLVDDIEVLERFSFVSVPFEAAEKAIAEARRQRGAPPVRIATPKGGPGGAGGPKRSYGPKGGYDKGKPYKPRGAGPGDAPGGKPYRKPRPAK